MMNARWWLASALRKMAKMNDVIRDTHGNLSCLDDDGIVWIKPSGMPYAAITYDHVGGYRLADGSDLGLSQKKPSVDLPHHLSIYRRNPGIRAICHIHSPYATAWAMSADVTLDVVCTEHADYFGHPIRIVGEPGRPDIDAWGSYVGVFGDERAVLLRNHGAMTFADDPTVAVELAAALENICQKYAIAASMSLNAKEIDDDVVDRWHRRYMDVYGQR